MQVVLNTICRSGLEFTGLQAQESVNASGGNASGNGGSVNYSIGLVTYQTYTGTTGSLAEGVQQPYIFSVHELELVGINTSLLAR